MAEAGLRRLVAREAANLLYRGVVHEYYQAKLLAAKSLGVRTLPSNLEVARELAKIGEEFGGELLKRRLISLRREALSVMKLLSEFHPKLIGSVWRGVITPQSDIDIEVYAENPKNVAKRLERFGKLRVERQTVRGDGAPAEVYHIYFRLPSGSEVEVVVRPPEHRHERRRCEIFGDIITGLTLNELERLLREEPDRKFAPLV